MIGAARKTNKVLLPFPHPGQQIVRRQARRFNWLMAGRRWRKTTLAMAIAVEAALAGKRIIWGAPVYDQVRVGWDETLHSAGNVGDFNTGRMTAYFPGGGEIIYRSLDNPDNVRSHTADGVVIDEAGDVHETAYSEVLRPMLITTEGWLWAIGTPKGVNWFAREHARAKDRDDSISWQAPTLGVRIVDGRLERAPHFLENPDISFDEIVNLWETLPQDTFRQEILAEAIRNEGAVFRNIRANMTAPLNAKPEDHAGHTTVAGVDWAQKHDFTAISVGCADCMCELELDRFNQIGWSLQRGRLSAIVERWNVAHIEAEQNSIGGPNIEALQDEGLPIVGFETTAASKPPLIKSLALSLEREEFRFLDLPVATSELEGYESKVNPVTSRVSYSAPEGAHDDTVIARALLRRAVGMGATGHAY